MSEEGREDHCSLAAASLFLVVIAVGENSFERSWSPRRYRSSLLLNALALDFELPELRGMGIVWLCLRECKESYSHPLVRRHGSWHQREFCHYHTEEMGAFGFNSEPGGQKIAKIKIVLFLF